MSGDKEFCCQDAVRHEEQLKTAYKNQARLEGELKDHKTDTKKGFDNMTIKVETLEKTGNRFVIGALVFALATIVNAGVAFYT